jgi:ABC-2 type transport system permease protein
MDLRRELRAFWALFRRDMLKLFRERARIVSSLMQPIIFLGIFGLGLKDVLGAAGPFQELDYIQYIFPGIIGTNVLGLTISNGVTIVADREFGFLREVLVAPISRLTIALGKVAAGVGTALVQVAVLMLLSPFVGLTPEPEMIPKLFAAVALLAVATSGLGVLIASRIRSTESFQYMFQFLIFPLFFLSGAFFVLDRVPTWIAVIANLNPLTYAIDLFRHILYADIELSAASSDLLLVRSVGQDIVIIGIISAVLLLASAWSFTRSE